MLPSQLHPLLWAQPRAGDHDDPAPVVLGHLRINGHQLRPVSERLELLRGARVGVLDASCGTGRDHLEIVRGVVEDLLEMSRWMD